MPDRPHGPEATAKPGDARAGSRQLTRVILLLLVAVQAAMAFPGVGQETAGTRRGVDPEAAASTAPVELDGHVLFRVRGVSALPAERRAARIRDRIEALARNPEFHTETLRLVQSDVGTRIMAGDELVMTVLDADARIEGVKQQELALTIADRIRGAVVDYRAARTPERLLQGWLSTLGATGVLAALVVLVLWLGKRVDAFAERRLHRRIHTLEIGSFEVLRAERIWGAFRGLLHGVRTLAILALVLVYLHFVLSQFPGTRPVAAHLLGFVSGPLWTIGQALLAAIPNLIFLIILFLIVRFALRMLHMFFDAVARGSVTLSGFEAAWAWPTYKIARLALVAFGLIVAYPYIPGSQSAAFKGISLFLGVVFSLGSSSAISNVIAGYTMTYRRAFKLGDRVQIGEMIGDVIEMRLQVTHLRSLKNEEVVIPNSMILNGQVVNYSSLASRQGLILHTTVGIGYEVPWRQVEAMLLTAAGRTPGLLSDPRPFILQRSLGDFAVSYELNAYCGDAQRMLELYTALHRNILDAFNEYGVQIMTPAYVHDPERAKVVPPEQWYAAPAAPEQAESLPDQTPDPNRAGAKTEVRVRR